MNIITIKSNLPTSSPENAAETTQSEKGADVFADIIQQAGVQQSQTPTSAPTSIETKGKADEAELVKAKSELQKLTKHFKKDGKTKVKNNSLAEQELIIQAQLLNEKIASLSASAVSSLQNNLSHQNVTNQVTDELNEIDPNLNKSLQQNQASIPAELLKQISQKTSDKQSAAAEISSATALQTDLANVAIPDMKASSLVTPKLDLTKSVSSSAQASKANNVQPSSVIQRQTPVNVVDSITKVTPDIGDINATQSARSSIDSQTMVAQPNHQQSKTASLMTELGSVLQNQVSQVISNPASLLAADFNSSHINTNNVTSGVNDNLALDAKQYETDINYTDNAAAQMKDVYEANFKMYPPELGSVLAKLKVNKNDAQLVILTENDRVRDIVAASLPQLRDHFQQGNLNLTNIQIQTSSGGTGDQNMSRQQQSDKIINESAVNDAKGQSLPSKQSPKSSDKIVDTYV